MKKLDPRVQRWLGIGAALFAAIMAFGDEMADRQRTKEIEEMKEDISRLKKEREE